MAKTKREDARGANCYRDLTRRKTPSARPRRPCAPRRPRVEKTIEKPYLHFVTHWVTKQPARPRFQRRSAFTQCNPMGDKIASGRGRDRWWGGDELAGGRGCRARKSPGPEYGAGRGGGVGERGRLPTYWVNKSVGVRAKNSSMYAVVALPSMKVGSLMIAFWSGMVVLMPRMRYSLRAR